MHSFVSWVATGPFIDLLFIQYHCSVNSIVSSILGRKFNHNTDILIENMLRYRPKKVCRLSRCQRTKSTSAPADALKGDL